MSSSEDRFEALAVRIAQWDESSGALGRHSLLLASLGVLLVGIPLIEAISGIAIRPAYPFALVLIAAIIVNRPQRFTFAITAVLGVAALVALVAAEGAGSQAWRLVSDGFGLALLGMTTVVMLNSLIYTRAVSADTIVGGVCAYLMIGLCFAVLFGMIAAFEPGAIASDAAAGAPAVEIGASDVALSPPRLLYFSFTTLTTLGYGDLAPRTELTQMLAVGEAIIGQLYLAIFLARLIGMFVHPVLDEDLPPRA